jgi:ABC-type siderophore export system fused ATPase/permease subunit
MGSRPGPVLQESLLLQFSAGIESESKAVVVIGHDERYYNVAGRIIRLDSGRIVNDHLWSKPFEKQKCGGPQ